MLRIRAYEVEIEKIVERETHFLRLYFSGRGDEFLEMDRNFTVVKFIFFS